MVCSGTALLSLELRLFVRLIFVKCVSEQFRRGFLPVTVVSVSLARPTMLPAGPFLQVIHHLRNKINVLQGSCKKKIKRSKKRGNSVQSALIILSGRDVWHVKEAFSCYCTIFHLNKAFLSVITCHM